MYVELKQRIEEAVSAIRERCSLEPEIGMVLGTGLGNLGEEVENPVTIVYRDIPHFPVSTVDSHAGELILGTLAGRPVVVLSGRFHLYEGYSLEEVTFPVRVARALGIHTFIIYNAAGGLNPQFSAGDIMVISDHINMMGGNPLIGPNDDTLGPRFPDMSEPYSKKLIELAETIALEQGIKLQRGVYLGCTGPCLETRAEYRFMRLVGADAVGMSTVPEVIVAVHAGLRTLAFSVITDECLPDALQPAEIEKIIAVANSAAPKLAAIVKGCIGKMDPFKRSCP